MVCEDNGCVRSGETNCVRNAPKTRVRDVLLRQTLLGISGTFPPRNEHRSALGGQRPVLMTSFGVDDRNSRTMGMHCLRIAQVCRAAYGLIDGHSGLSRLLRGHRIPTRLAASKPTFRVHVNQGQPAIVPAG